MKEVYIARICWILAGVVSLPVAARDETMKTPRRGGVPLLAFLVMLLIAGHAPAASASADATPPFLLAAKDVLPGKLLQGDNYIVAEEVQNDGLINTYRLTTAYGPMEVESTAELMIRIAELNAMSVMAQMDKKKVFGDAVIEGAKAPIRGIGALVTDPVATSKGIVSGTGRFFTNLGRSIVSDDPYQDNAFKVAVGYDATKRAYAYELGIDVYSSYEPVISMLGQVAQASVAGGLAPRAAMASVNVDVMTVLNLSGTSESMRKLVRDNPPGELEKINSRKLAEIGIPSAIATAFLNNYLYNPQETTLLVGHLDDLAGVKGRDEFLATVNLVSRRSQARLYRIMMELLAGYHNRVTAVKRLDLAAGIPYLSGEEGTAVFLLPLDRVFPTQEVQDKLARLDAALAQAGVTGKALWVTGTFDESARDMFKQAGWKVVEKAGEKLTKQ